MDPIKKAIRSIPVFFIESLNRIIDLLFIQVYTLVVKEDVS